MIAATPSQVYSMNDLCREEMAEHGSNAGRGNLLGIQPFMTAADYASEGPFHAKIDGYLSAAAKQGWLSERTIVVLPEYLGTWLAAAEEGPGFHQARSLTGAMRALALRHVFALAGAVLSATEKDRVTASLFRIKAERMARIYQDAFSALAKKYAVTIVAGSILLPSPRVTEGRLVAGRGALQNVSAVYGPDGQAHPALARKIFPTTDEKPFVGAAMVGQLPTFDTPAGRLGVLICADSWYPPPYERLKAQGVELIAVPSFIDRHDAWNKPWGGYDGAPAPGDVNLADVGVLTEGQAWRKYAIAGRIAQAGARYGLNVFLRGELWDLGTDGRYTAFANGVMTAEASGGRTSLVNVWL